MAEVMLAVRRTPGGAGLAVLKCIRPELATDPDFFSMFMHEAHLALRLRSPHIVETFEVLPGEEQLAIAREFLDGQPLGRALSRLRGPAALPLAHRLRVVSDLLAALDHAHQLRDDAGAALGIVHRDVSPQNVFVTYDGRVKLVDFGVAKSLAASHYTRPGRLKGRLHYMAPEQLSGLDVDARTDLFSVGVLLWELVACQRFWGRLEEGQIMGQLMSSETLPPPETPPALPAEVARHGLDAICSRALARDPDRRYQSAAEMKAAIDAVRDDLGRGDERELGQIVAGAFDRERECMQQLIDAHLESPTRPDGAPTPRAPTSAGVAAGSGATGSPSSSGRSRVLGTPATVAPVPARWRSRVARVGLVAGLLALVGLAAAARARSSWRVAIEAPSRSSAHPLSIAAATAPRAAPAPAPRVVAAHEPLPPRPVQAPLAPVGPAPAPELVARRPPPAGLTRRWASARGARDDARLTRPRSSRARAGTAGAWEIGTGDAGDPFDHLVDRPRAPASKRALDLSDPFGP
jgi:serine/threonine-protein kinase